VNSALADPDLDHLWHRLGLVEGRVREAVAARQVTDPAPADPYRGLYLTPEDVRRILADRRDPDRRDPDRRDPGPPGPPRLARLSDRFGLSELDAQLLLVALAPDIDARFERLYGYLNDDVTRRRASIGLALELCGLPAAGGGRFRFAPAAPLVAGGLLEVHDPDRPALTRALRVPDRVVGYLLGDDQPDPALAGVATLAGPAPGTAAGPAGRIGAALAAAVPLLYLRERDGGAAPAAVAALAAAGRPALLADAEALAADPVVATALVREARLRDAGIVIGPLEAGDPGRPLRALTALTALATGVPVLAHGRRGWDPGWTPHPALTLDVPPLAPAAQAALWRHAVVAATGAAPTVQPGEVLAGHRLGAGQIERVATVAARLARIEDRAVGPADLRAGLRTLNGVALERLARRITPMVGWDDLVLPELTAGQLRELATRARYRDHVLGRWGMRPGGGRGSGVVALFAGESGTGKTMSAEVVAADLGMDLYVVDLAGVVDKYVGETEKNLERIFTEAENIDGVLLFDEADAVFGRRSAVESAQDRYANLESAYLLQRLESFEGIAVLTTNLRSNVDSAFLRRLDVVADFPLPDATHRRRLWERCLGPAVPRGADLDLAFCAERFELAGGSIRACAISAAYQAAAGGGPVGMARLIAAIRQEYRKLGRLLLDSEFGPWLDSG
jgi:hypothetical protein